MSAEPCLKCQLAAARRETDRLFNLVSPHNLYQRPIPQRHRLIFYLGHLEAFDYNQIATLQNSARLHPIFDSLFERGIDPPPGQLPSDKPSDWPTVGETCAYLRASRERIDTLWPKLPHYLQQLLVEHRWMHAETFSYILHNLSHDLKLTPPSAEPEVFLPTLVQHRSITIPEGTATLGKPRDGRFGWDNEYDEITVPVPEFAIDKYKITNADYLAFVKQGQTAPFFWTLQNSQYYTRGMFDLTPLTLDAPVYVTLDEARAYADWKGLRLPTEPEYHRAAYATPEGDERAFPWGNDPGHAPAHGNFDFLAWDPVPVTAFPGGQSAFGVTQLIGNGWEWTTTPFAPFPGFTPTPSYPLYSADFFDDQHFVLKGASPRTASLLTRRSFRNWFRSDYPYLYATFRLVEN